MINIILSTISEDKNNSSTWNDDQQNCCSFVVKSTSSKSNTCEDQGFTINAQSCNSCTRDENENQSSNFIQIEDFLLGNASLVCCSQTPGVYSIRYPSIFSNPSEVIDYLAEVFNQYGGKDEFFVKKQLN